MQKTGKIEKLSIGDIRNTTKDNCTKLIDAIGAVVDRNLGMSCSVVSVNHSYEYKILITNKTSSVQLETKEKPGNTLRKTNEPTELHFFTYDGENGACPPTRSGLIHPLLNRKTA